MVQKLGFDTTTSTSSATGSSPASVCRVTSDTVCCTGLFTSSFTVPTLRSWLSVLSTRSGRFK